MNYYKIYPNNLSFRRIFQMLIIVILLFSSCSTMRTIPIEVATLPKERIPNEIQSLTLINRAANSRFKDFRGDSLQQVFYQRQFNVDTVLLDLKASDTLLIALGNILFESGRFDVVIPENRFPNINSYRYIPTALSWEEADSLVHVYNTDAILSLDYFNHHLVTKYRRMSVFNQSSNDFFPVYMADITIAYETMFRIYYPFEKRLISNIVVSDTLYWEDSDLDIRDLFKRFTTVKGALIEAGIHAVLNYSEKIAPQWSTSRRNYFAKGHPMLERAHQLVTLNDWQGASDLWKKLAGSSPKSLKSKAEFNLALAYEMFGDIEEAIRWALKSYETMYRPVTYNYIERLNIRKQEIAQP